LNFFDDGCTYFAIEFRIVRILLDNGTYICIATNLSEEEFPLEEIKKALQNEMERGNKFSGTENIRLVSSTGTVASMTGILQEINARMILYTSANL